MQVMSGTRFNIVWMWPPFAMPHLDICTLEMCNVAALFTSEPGRAGSSRFWSTLGPRAASWSTGTCLLHDVTDVLAPHVPYSWHLAGHPSLVMFLVRAQQIA